MKLLDIKNLTTEFNSENGVVKAVRDVSFYVDKGEAVGIVGESGSGKSVTMLSVMGLLSENGEVVSGEIEFNGKDISPITLNKQGKKAYENVMQKIRGKEMGMIFQDPMTFLNPVLKVGKQLTETILQHEKVTKDEANKRAINLLNLVGIPNPEKRLHQYPHEFSGGMRQRLIIACALSCNPKLIIADEPTTALDVTIQAQVLELIEKLQKETDTSVLMITHDLGVVAAMCSRIIIMYGGKIVEQGTADEIFYEGKHPYTLGLLNSVTNPDSDIKEPLIPIPGSPPDLLHPPAGCPFVDRCDRSMKICKTYMPEYTVFSDTHQCACWLNHPMAKEGE